MVDLGQKGWKQFHLFYWNQVKEKDLKRSSNDEISLIIDFICSSTGIFGIATMSTYI
jgi:hypothetical protein